MDIFVCFLEMKLQREQALKQMLYIGTVQLFIGTVSVVTGIIFFATYNGDWKWPVTSGVSLWAGLAVSINGLLHLVYPCGQA